MLESKIEDFLPMFDYLGINKVVPHLVRHILKHTERDTEKGAQRGIKQVASICRERFPGHPMQGAIMKVVNKYFRAEWDLEMSARGLDNKIRSRNQVVS